MEILSQTALTRNGNPYRKTRKMQVAGAILGAGASIASNTNNILKNAPKTKAEGVAMISAAAVSAFIMGSLGKLFGSVFDDKTNRVNAEQTDILNAVIEQQLYNSIASSEIEE